MYIGLNKPQIFPVIDSLAFYKTQIDKPEIRFMEQENETVICSYIISCEGTFDNKYALEARGITFNDRGKVISRSLHKFFNVNEKPTTLAQVIDWSKVKRVMYKRDGSMITTVGVKNTDSNWPSHFNFDLKSKKSYTSDVARSAKDHVILAESTDFHYGDLCNWCIDNDVTAIFEWTSPSARIVVHYPQNSLSLLHVRENFTGEYYTAAQVKELGAKYNIPVVEDESDLLEALLSNPDLAIIKIQEIAGTIEGIEGWVFQFENGDMVKWKTKWYMDRHRAMTFIRERDIAKLALDETLDDLKAILVGEGADITEILEIENRVVKDIDLIINAVCSIVADHRHLDRKSMAMQFSAQGENHPYFKLIMHKYEGKEPDYKGFYERNVLPSIPLRQLNLLQTLTETDE